MGDFKRNAFINETVKSLFIDSHVLSSLGKAAKAYNFKDHIFVRRGIISLLCKKEI